MDFNSLNKVTYRKPYKNVKDLEVNQKFQVLKVSSTKTKYGDRVLIETDDFQCILPVRYFEYLKEDGIEKLNQSLNDNKTLYIINKGSNGVTVNIEFSN